MSEKRLSEQHHPGCNHLFDQEIPCHCALSRIAELKAELEKWQNWRPDDETLALLQEQARARDSSYTNGLAAQTAYIGGLEGRLRQLEAKKRRYQRLLYWALMQKDGQDVPWNGEFRFNHEQGLAWFLNQAEFEALGDK